MFIKLFYKDPSDKNGKYDKDVVFVTSISYQAPECKFKHKFACEVSSIADNNNISRDLVYRAQLLTNENVIIYEREGIPINVIYKSYIVDIFFPIEQSDIKYWFDSCELCAFYWEGNIYINRNLEQWNRMEEFEQNNIIEKVRKTLKTGIFGNNYNDRKILPCPQNLLVCNN